MRKVKPSKDDGGIDPIVADECNELSATWRSSSGVHLTTGVSRG
jgi:hypothetical protein